MSMNRREWMQKLATFAFGIGADRRRSRNPGADGEAERDCVGKNRGS